MSIDYAAHYRSIRDHLIDFARLDRAYAIDAAQRYERESFGALKGLAADVKAALSPASTPARAGRANRQLENT